MLGCILVPMVYVGSLQYLIALFTLIGSTLLGIGAMLVTAAGGEIPSATAEIRLQVDTDRPLPDGAWVQQTIQTLEARFPGADVAEMAREEGLPKQFTVTGPLEGTDVELGQLAVATGDLHLRMTASDEDERELGIQLAAEQQKVEAYLTANPGNGVLDYNALGAEEGGSPERLVFALEDNQGAPVPVALMTETSPEWRFDETALSRVFASSDHSGRPALGFDIDPSRRRDFFRFTKAHIGQQLAVVVGDRILTRPNLNSPLEVGGLITGGALAAQGFWEEDVARFIRILSAPRLPQRLQLISIERRAR